MRASIVDGCLRLTAENAKENVELRRVAQQGHLHLVMKGSGYTRQERAWVQFQVSLLKWMRPAVGFGWKKQSSNAAYRRWRKTPGARKALGFDSPITQARAGFLAGWRYRARGGR